MGKNVLITGASTGIGAATAIELANNNHVFLHYHSSEPEVRRVALAVQEAGGTATLVRADLTLEHGCTEIIEVVRSQTDRLDILVNNAGGLVARQSIPDIEWELMQTVFALNVFSLIKVSSLCVPLLRNGKDSSIVNISSIVVRHGAAGATLYGAAKGAVDVFTRGMAKELAPAIRVNAIAPGVIETPFHDKVSKPEQLKSWREACPLKRNGSAQDIAQAVHFVIDNTFMTGETVDVNGGMFMR